MHFQKLFQLILKSNCYYIISKRDIKDIFKNILIVLQ